MEVLKNEEKHKNSHGRSCHLMRLKDVKKENICNVSLATEEMYGVIVISP